jgi:hypothetical protein
MKHLLASTAVACLLASPAFAIDNNTAVGVGIAGASSSANSQSGALAVGGGLGVGFGGNATATGGNATNVNVDSNRATAVNRNANVNSTNVISSVPANQSIKTVPSVFAPGLAAAGIETCQGSVSGGGSFLGTGITLGGTLPDTGCNARLDARTLWAFGLRKAAVARLCLSSEINASMPDVCGRYQPRVSPQWYSPAYTPAVRVASFGERLPPGQIWLEDGDTHETKICGDYDKVHKHCKKWVQQH